MGKFRNVRTQIGSVVYDSKSEATYALMLQAMLKEGKIRSVQRQIKYLLPNMEGQMRMAYIADFVVVNTKGNEFIIDIKGLLTPANKVKLAYFQTYHNKKIHLVFNRGPFAFRTDFLLG